MKLEPGGPVMHASGAFVRFTPAVAELLANECVRPPSASWMCQPRRRRVSFCADQSAGGEMFASLLMALMEVPAFRTIVDSSSLVSLRRFRMTFTCTRSLKSRELRKYVGLRRFMLVADG